MAPNVWASDSHLQASLDPEEEEEESQEEEQREESGGQPRKSERGKKGEECSERKMRSGNRCKGEQWKREVKEMTWRVERVMVDSHL